MKLKIKSMLLILFIICFTNNVLANALEINSIEPASGYNTTETNITIKGKNFDSTYKVYIGAGGSYSKSSVVTPGYACGAYVKGNYVYVADGSSGLQIIDISNPANPVIVGSVDTPRWAQGVYVSGNYAYVADEYSGLQIIDISNLEVPKIVGSVKTNNAIGIYVNGSYAYVADGSSGLQIIDISSPTAPAITGSVDMPGDAYGVYISWDYAYVADGLSGLQIIDISSPVPVIVGSVDTPGNAIGVCISGNYAYVADFNSGLQIIDISNPVNPAIVSSVSTTNVAYGVYTSGNYVYVIDYYSGLQIIDISSPTAPVKVGGVATPRVNDTPGVANGVYINGNYAYVAYVTDFNSGLQIIDISNPVAPAIISGVDTPDIANEVYISGNYAYVSDGSSGLQIINISNPENPAIIGSVDMDMSGDAIGVYISGNYAYVASYVAYAYNTDWYSGLQIVDISNPIAPVIVGNVNTGDANGVYISGNYAYVTDWNSRLQIIDISNPIAPAKAGSVDTGNALGVYVNGNYVYVANGLSGLQIIHKQSSGTVCESLNFIDDTILKVTIPKGLLPGKYNIKVINSNREEFILHNSFTILALANQSPKVNLTADKTTGDVPLLVNFTADATDIDGIVAKYEWNLDTNKSYETSTNTNSITYTYSNAGTYEARVKVTDNDGSSAEANLTITVNQSPLQNQPPIANDALINTIENIPINITLTGTDPDGYTLIYIIVSQPSNGILSGATPNLTYAPNNNFTGVDNFTFKVNDGKKDSNTATINITITPANSIENQPPIVNLTSNKASGTTPLTINFIATASDNDGSIVKYEWDFNGDKTYDKDTGTTSTTSNTYTITGIYNAKVRATDDKGAVAEATTTIKVIANNDENNNTNESNNKKKGPCFIANILNNTKQSEKIKTLNRLCDRYILGSFSRHLIKIYYKISP
ncbi:PKD domain-containing protein [Candidatus Desantisbacteria bacterium]|nr:PKD domain-containing protein [Candidatus Desantisbacteria bacterium]